MPGPYVEDLPDRFDYETDWVEILDNNEKAGAHFAGTTQEDTLIGYVAWSKRRDALRFFNGFAYADTAAPWRLHREQPHRHPDYPWLRAFGCSFNGMTPRSNSANPNRSPYDLSPFTPVPQTRRSRYQHAVTSVQYRAWGDVWFLEDDEIPDAENEWWRNTLFLPPQATVEALTVTGGLAQLIFSEGGGTGPTAQTTRFTAPVAMLQTKVAFRLVWYHVPWEYLSSSNNLFWPDKILACLGRVNSDTFLDEFEPGTVYFPSFEVETFPWWVASADPTEPLIGCNVTFEFSWFDPPTGIGPPYRKGHNNMPWSGDGTVNGDGKYYRATFNGQNDGRPLIEEVPFSGMFTHVESP